MLPPFPVIVGPTAGGKSALAIALAGRLEAEHALHAEIVSADSMQVYRCMDIGTAKPTNRQRAAVPHHLIDIVEPSEPFSVDRWLALAEPLINDLRKRDALPIVVGGTHLYAKALLEGLFESPEPEAALRAELNAMQPHRRRKLLERVDPDAAARIHPNDTRRTVRALEVWRATGVPISMLQRQWDRGRVRADAILVGLEWPTDLINRAINARVRKMMDAGFLQEVAALRDAGRLGPQARHALGYRQLLDHLEGRADLDDAVERIKIETRRFAKNQRTWLRRLRATPGASWIDASRGGPDDWAQSLVSKMHTPTEPGEGAVSPPNHRNR